jgi:hypothetical protein
VIVCGKYGNKIIVISLKTHSIRNRGPNDIMLLGFQSVMSDTFHHILLNVLQYVRTGNCGAAQLVLSFEAVGVLAGLILKGEVYDYSENGFPQMRTIRVNKTIKQKNSQESCSYRYIFPESISRLTLFGSEPSGSDDNKDNEPGKIPSTTSISISYQSYRKWISIIWRRPEAFSFLPTVLRIYHSWISKFGIKNLQVAEPLAHHRCNIPENSIYYQIRSFLSNDIMSIRVRRGYYSVVLLYELMITQSFGPYVKFHRDKS